MTTHQEYILKSIKESLLNNLPHSGRALLYGSQARGDNHEGSDWDVLIILDEERVSLTRNTSITYPLVMLGWELGEEINPIVYTRKEWEASCGTPFYQNVEHDAIKIA